ncbi:peptide-N(4)-(N-acetyl-beta-glucosaminyl) asparagine amidase [Mucor ambiguus]|uniref:Peptide-N(4)-(N-acetyl-beta-glucosaminyl) asparagine amidase n=1 Tax=Mucor ambiguus TaxID=91626 RepID=A0A0C9LWM7_9FUNG|nr:peptide-N(4)-(N-acetyl-beta-glucosaminyl) asparagine amidase [Mucor ambiguus]
MQAVSSVQEKAFMKQLELNGSIVFQYENQELLDKALESIPLQRLYEEAESKMEEQGGEGSLEDSVIQRLLHWFKNEFFTWVNNAPCEYCQNTQTRGVNHLQPTTEELRFGANVVEGYHCSSCNRITRFPRYKYDPGKLLETRRGRCGEWANCFTLCCRAVGSEARIVYDTTDHVWTEVYSEYEQRWIHCDSCEEAWDRPLLYSVGWNKKLNYCTAFSVDEALDVTKRYTRNWPEVLTRRTKIREPRLAVFLEGMTAKRQENVDQNRKNVLNQRRVKELMELEEDSRKVAVKDNEMIGRQSGSLAWRTSRGETGETATTENLMSKLELNDWKKQKLDIQYTLLGNAAMQCDGRSFVPNVPYIRITSAMPDQRGGVYCKQLVQLDNNLKGIEVEFAFRITNGSGQEAVNGADGFAFLIQAQGEHALGGGGCELGYGGVRHSLAVEFDTYQSSDRCADPSANHISIHGRKPPHSNSAHQDYSLGHTSRIPPLQCGKWIKSKIRLLSNGIIEIGLAEVGDKEYIQVLKVSNQNFMDYLMPKESAWVGFTASTGGLAENHDVQMISLSTFTE